MGAFGHLSFLLYVATGVVVFVGLWVLFRKTKAHAGPFKLLATEAILFWPFLWPVFALLFVLWWLLDRLHFYSKEAKDSEALKGTNKYAHRSMDELISEQKRALDELRKQK